MEVLEKQLKIVSTKSTSLFDAFEEGRRKRKESMLTILLMDLKRKKKGAPNLPLKLLKGLHGFAFQPPLCSASAHPISFSSRGPNLNSFGIRINDICDRNLALHYPFMQTKQKEALALTLLHE